VYAVADDAYLNVQFDPAYVKEYRVIGFDNKVGAIRDPEAIIDGGEIGSAYSSVVAFEIIPTRLGQEMAANKQFFQPVNFLLHYKIPHTSQSYQLTDSAELAFTSFVNVPEYYRFASSVIMFGSFLRKSKFARDISLNDIFHLAAISADPADFSQKEFVALVHQARTVYGKRKKKEKDLLE
jgi:Ca-activated chloride channel family protein